LYSKSGIRSIVYNQRTQKSVDDRADKYNGQVVNYMQQGAIPSMGSAGGLCYGYSYIFTNAFNDLPENATLEETQRALKGNQQTELTFNNNSLGMSLAAYTLWDSQFDVPPKDCLYKDTSKTENADLSGINKVKDQVERNFEFKKFKRNNFCNQIMHHSQKMPCTFMLTIRSKVNGHAIGFSRNKNGIWLHDSNFGLVFFDSNNPNYERDFKRFLSNHIKTHYPNLQHDFAFANTKIQHNLVKSCEATQASIAGLEELYQKLCPDAITNENERCEKFLSQLKEALPDAHAHLNKNLSTHRLTYPENLLVNLDAIKQVLDDEIENIVKIKKGFEKVENISDKDKIFIAKLDERLETLQNLQFQCSHKDLANEQQIQEKQLKDVKNEYLKMSVEEKEQPNATLNKKYKDLQIDIQNIKIKQGSVINPSAIHAAHIKKAKIDLNNIFNPNRKDALNTKDKIKAHESLGVINQAQGYLISRVQEQPSILNDKAVLPTFKRTSDQLKLLAKAMTENIKQPKMENPSTATSIQNSLTSFMGKLRDNLGSFLKDFKKLLSPKKNAALLHKERHKEQQVLKADLSKGQDSSTVEAKKVARPKNEQRQMRSSKHKL